MPDAMAESQAIYQMGITPGMGYITSPEGRKAEQDALRSDKEQCHRVVVNIVGKERQGKTSLRRMLVWEPFDEDEESTVGIDHDLVETLGIQPSTDTSWSKVDLARANEDDFDIILGKHIRQHLKKASSSAPRLKNVIVPLLCFTKIAIITYLGLYAYFFAVSSATLRGFPWFGCILIFIFMSCGLVFGIRDGYGIAVGAYHLLTMSDAVVRWDLPSCFEMLYSKSCLVVVLVIGYLSFALIESVVGICFGLSLGVGIACAYCLMEPPETIDNGVSNNPIWSPHMITFLVCGLLGVCSANFKTLLFYVVVPTVAVMTTVLPYEYIFIIACGIGCGNSHAVCLKIGQNKYCILNGYIKKVTDSPRLRRYLRHAVALLPGIVMGHILGWRFSSNIFSHAAVAVLLLLSIELSSMLSQASQSESEKTPCGAIRNPSKVITARVKSAGLKLVVRDFAGHPLYYTAHHLYMTGQCIYLLVFNLVEAKADFLGSFQRMLQWLQSIYVHNHYPDVRVFIIATHRDDHSLSKDDINRIEHRLKKELPRQFHNLVVWRSDDLPVFRVENSVRDPKDADHHLLKQKIMDEVLKSFTEHYPLKYFYFFRVLAQFRLRGVLIEKRKTVFEICQSNECSMSSYDEFEELLNFFNRIGEIIYINDDNMLQDYIVLDHRAVTDLISRVMTIPKMADRTSDFMPDWELLETSAICTRKLFQTVASQTVSSGSITENLDAVIHLLENLNLLCPIQRGGQQDLNISTNEEIYYLIPALLSPDLLSPQNYWEDGFHDYVFYLKCTPVLPMAVFLRLVALCASRDPSLVDEDGVFRLNASQTKALFTMDGEYSYKLEMTDPVQHCRLLKIVVRCGDRTVEPEALVMFIWDAVRKITQREFPKCQLQLCVRCPCQNPHQNCPQDESLHVLPLSVLGQTSGELGIPLKKEFWCRGRKICFQGARATVVVGREKRDAVPLRDLLATPIPDLPQHIYSGICDMLNIHNVLQRDWRLLAGKLGKSHRDVRLLESLSPRDPCDALLQDWATREPCATLRDLVDILQEMERLDVIHFIENG